MAHDIHIIGGGLAGSEAAWQLAEAGYRVRLSEMRGGGDMTPAHQGDTLAEMVCSNSFRSDDGDSNAVGLLHREMRSLVAEGRFREDLFYRLNVIPVSLPPLRDRRSDIAALVRYFVDTGRQSGLPDREFAPEAMQLLERHDWPGNVRELGNVVQRLAILARDTVVTARDVETVLREVRGNQLEAARRLGINRNTLRKRLGQLDIDPAHP